MNTFARLQSWYLNRCNDLWEHAYGISIDNIDNPGWQIKIDLKDTYLEHVAFPAIYHNCNDINSPIGHDWYSCKRDSSQFLAACGPLLLESVLKVFLDWADSSQNDDKTEQGAAANP